MLPTTSERVPRHTPTSLNRAIHSGINESVRRHAAHPERIDERLVELDREWDIERTLEANAATLAFTGVVLGGTVDKRWLALPALVTAFCSSTPCRAGAHPSPCCAGSGFAPCERSTRNGSHSRPFAGTSARSAPVGRTETAAPAMPCKQQGSESWLFRQRMAAFQYLLASCSGAGSGRVLRWHCPAPNSSMAPHADERGLPPR
jgi:hypothetical protein